MRFIRGYIDKEWKKIEKIFKKTAVRIEFRPCLVLSVVFLNLFKKKRKNKKKKKKKQMKKKEGKNSERGREGERERC